MIHGQGFVYLSNTNQAINNSNWTAGDIWIPFTTGSNASGYLLDAVTVLFASNNVPVVMTAAVFDYSAYTYFYTGTQVGSAGYYTLAPNAPISLAANTPYVMLVLPASALASVNWNFITSSAVTSVNNWSTSLSDGSDIPVFAISATPITSVPEPAVVPLVFLGAIVFIVFRKSAFFTIVTRLASRRAL